MSMKYCDWCNKDMKQPNFKKHIERCFYKNELNIKKNDLDQLLKKKTQRKDDNNNNDNSDNVDLQIFKTFFNKIEHEITRVRETIIRKEQDPMTIIENLPLEKSTKGLYKSEWKQFSKFCQNKKLPKNQESANIYIGKLQCAISTKHTKRNMMQNILKNLFENENLKLKPIRQTYSSMPKHTLTDEELEDYLKEQKGKNPELHLTQLLMATYGLRVSTVAALQRRHLDFMDCNINKITLPDVKSKKQRTESITEELKKLMLKHIEKRKLKDNDYVFYEQHNDKELDVRARYLCKDINKQLNETNAFKKSKNFKYTSHMFRKTEANKQYQEEVNVAKDKARKRIGHAQSNNIDKYLD
jgi:integrase